MASRCRYPPLFQPVVQGLARYPEQLRHFTGAHVIASPWHGRMIAQSVQPVKHYGGVLFLGVLYKTARMGKGQPSFQTGGNPLEPITVVADRHRQG